MFKLLSTKWVYVVQLCFFCCLFSAAKAQDATACDTSVRYLYWTGEVNNDFFNEKNWRVTVEKPSTDDGTPGKPTCLPGGGSHLYAICPNVHEPVNDKYPKDKSLEPGQPIRFNLYIESANVLANGGISFACAQKGITLTNAQLTVQGGTVSRGALSLLNESTVYLREGSMSPTLLLNFLDAASWVYLYNESPDALMTKLGNILVDHVAGTIDENFRINQYYQKGSVVRPLSAALLPLKIYAGTAQTGSVAHLQEDIIYTGASIPNGMDNAARSFVLKRGFMATFAVNSNGTGKSKVYIASENDLIIDALDVALQGNVSFIRVVPWNWVVKKGTGGFYDQLHAGWFYNWNNNNNPLPNYEYVPMAWGAGGALPAGIGTVLQKKKTTHLLGFNESDNCEDQSGQYNNLCQPAVAVAYYENLMSLGVRLGTPAPRENGPSTWLLEFARIAKERDVRFDFVAVHWYDWGSNPAGSPNADPQQIFNRFKAYLANVYNIYKLPIWITEFNANPNRGNATQEAFLRLALPYLESLDYVERYAYFQPNSAYATVPQTPADYYDSNNELTNIGLLYKNHSSTASIPEATYVCPNNLEGLDLPYVSKPTNSLVFEAECGKYIGNQWDVLENEQASNGFYIRGNNSLTGASPIAKQVHFEFELAEAGSYRMWIRSASTGGAGAIRISVDGKSFEQISPFTGSTFTWFQVPRFYDLGEGKHRFSIEYPNSNLLLDQVLFTNGIENFDLLKKESGYCVPETTKWGLETIDVQSFYEAEAAAYGTSWSTQTSANAVGGVYMLSAEGVSATDVPEGTDKVIAFTVQVDKADEYDIWTKIQALKPSATGLWIAVDDEPFRKWNGLNNTTYEWMWRKFHYSYGAENRSFTYFLTAGQHEVRIAIGSGFVFADRIAVVTKGKLPEITDPNVLALSEKLEFEAEYARIITGAGTTGTVPTVVSCSTSSNLQQVNLGTRSGNWIAFDEVVADAAGPYKLKVSYMSKNARPFRIRVNGTLMGRQLVAPSGNWCYIDATNTTLGSPAVYEVVVILKRGLNTIELGLNNSDQAPFMDKIKLEKADLNGLGLEAELAELFGTSATVACTVASNGAQVNMGAAAANGIRYNNLVSAATKSYEVDIYYITKVQRNMRVSMNGEAFTTLTFDASGNWCYETTPVVAKKTITLNFVQGSNTIEFRPTGADAPFIDRIVIREVAPEVTTAANQQEVFGTIVGAQVLEQSFTNVFTVYPNPVKAAATLTVTLPDAVFTNGPAMLQLTDVNGRVVYTQNLLQQGNRQLRLTNKLNSGMYVLSIIQGKQRTSKKVVIQ
ncbi:putative secreted protein (Por secretion system target) [Lacibacter cauensis]|uniref:Putative secreted protein (Por secretion system target) n=1 Tax=Lacibacter cauensis TaxID=510947 RepID=A0A562SHM4_9BACT|nr:glycosyl hydrolase [Lacibacter cauensis]TWI80573.1 putative secreted protein (Por secretion system target) [Lacibacter cauensis]